MLFQLENVMLYQELCEANRKTKTKTTEHFLRASILLNAMY